MLIDFDNFIKNTPHPYSRETLTGHITGSCWIINRARDSVLLTHHKKLNIWIPPGGHSEGETEPIEIAQREGEEETGLKLLSLSQKAFSMDIHEIPQYKEVPAHKHYDYTFIFTVTGSEKFKVSDESHDLKWIKLNELQDYTKEDNVLKMRNRTLTLINSNNKTIFNLWKTEITSY